MVQTLSPNSNIEHQSQTWPYPSSCSSTAFLSIKKEQKSIGIPRTMRHLLLSILVCLFAKTRKRQLIDMLHVNGLSISYDRVLEISAQLGEAVVAQYVEDGVVCPPVLRKQLFTTAAVDNIDHNQSATTAQTSFHGTSLSIFQLPSPRGTGGTQTEFRHEGKDSTRASRSIYQCSPSLHCK